MVRPNREVQLNVQVQDWKRGSINIIKIVSVIHSSQHSDPGRCLCEQRARTGADDRVRLWKSQLSKLLRWIG